MSTMDRSARREAAPQPWSRRDLIGIGWVVAAAIGVMVPALRHGLSLGEYDWLSHYGVLQQPVIVHNGFGGDQITEMIPWTSLAWTQVHHGQLPLWNPNNVLGMPLAFNWQSAAFSLPSAIGYLFPLRMMYTVQVLVTLVVAGVGGYVFARVMRLGVMGSALAGTVVALNGPFFVAVGWPIASVLSWCGWLFAAIVLITRGKHPLRDIAFFGVALAFAIYAGEPDTLILLAAVLIVFALVLLGFRWKAGGFESITRPLRNLLIAAVTGGCLGAPLLLPGLQLADLSIRKTQGGGLNSQKALSAAYLARTAFPWLIGRPIIHEYKYIGIIAAVLVLVALVFRIKRPEVAAVAVVVVFTAALAFVPPVIHVVNALPGLHAVRLPRALNFFTFGLAMLAGAGLHVYVRSPDKKPVLEVTGVAFAAAAFGVVLFWLFDRKQLTVFTHYTRINGLHWATIGVATGVAVVLIELVAARMKARRAQHAEVSGHRRLAGRYGVRVLTATILLAAETVFLVGSGTSLWRGSTTQFPSTAASRALQGAVGSSLVGLGTPSCFFPPGLGIPVNANIYYGVREFAVYDPIVPREYYAAWRRSAGPAAQPGYPSVSHFCPGITSVALAHEYGIGFILESHGQPGPAGTQFDARIGNEDLYRVPGTSAAVLVSTSRTGAPPPDSTPGRPVPVEQPNPTTWRVQTFSRHSQILRLHLTNVPGWHASIDGKPLALEPYSLVMLQARIPPGPHMIELHYLPTTFVEGVVLALLAVVGLVSASVVVFMRRRTRLLRTGDLDGFLSRPETSG